MNALLSMNDHLISFSVCLFCRSFTSLSMSLGCMIASVHEGLIYSILNDTRPGVLTATLQAASAVVSATNYKRMPENLLVRITEVGCKVYPSLLQIYVLIVSL